MAHTHSHVYAYTHKYANTYTHTHTLTHTHTHTHMKTLGPMLADKGAHTHTQTHKHIHTHTHTHTHTQIQIHALACMTAWRPVFADRVRSMRMGLLYRGPSLGQDLSIYRGVAKPYRGLLQERWPLTKFFWHLFNQLLLFLPGLSTLECQPWKK